MTRKEQPPARPEEGLGRPSRPSAPGIPPRERRPHGVGAGVDDDLRARVTAERLEQGLSPQITDVTVLSRIALRLRQAASQAPVLERTRTQARDHVGASAPPQSRDPGAHALVAGNVSRGRAPGTPGAP
jgi:hypothetical protein